MSLSSRDRVALDRLIDSHERQVTRHQKRRRRLANLRGDLARAEAKCLEIDRDELRQNEAFLAQLIEARRGACTVRSIEQRDDRAMVRARCAALGL